VFELKPISTESIPRALARLRDEYERTQALAPPRNDDAVLRWSSCVRYMERNQITGTPAEQESLNAAFDDEAPPR
jgi:hypothetical protein